jgi:hypothetical protein
MLISMRPFLLEPTNHDAEWELNSRVLKDYSESSTDADKLLVQILPVSQTRATR